MAPDHTEHRKSKTEAPDRDPPATAPDEDPVAEASEESFPASDPPSFTPGEAGAPPEPGGTSDRPPTSDRIRTDTDRGHAADKVPAEDPAAAPLGTDAEAAGTTPNAAERAAAEEDDHTRAASTDRRGPAPIKRD